MQSLADRYDAYALVDACSFAFAFLPAGASRRSRQCLHDRQSQRRSGRARRFGYVRYNTVGTAFFDNLDLLADPDEPRDLFGMLLRRMSDHS